MLLGGWDVIKDTALRIHRLVTDPIGVVFDLGYMILYPVETAEYLADTIVHSFERDVLYGDNESRARWMTYAVGSLAEAVIGTKDVGAGLRVTKTGTKVRNVNKVDYELALAGTYQKSAKFVYDLNHTFEELLVRFKGQRNNENNFYISGKGDFVQPLGRGSTGRTKPKDLNEQLALMEVLTSLDTGKILPLRKGMTDPRWPSEEGWVKMTKNVNGIEIHYLKNNKTGQFDDFKFID